MIVTQDKRFAELDIYEDFHYLLFGIEEMTEITAYFPFVVTKNCDSNLRVGQQSCKILCRCYDWLHDEPLHPPELTAYI